MSDADEAVMLRRADALVATLPAASEPYWVATEIMAAVSGALITSLTACHLYRMWAALTDWYELKPDERPEAVATMRRAATEWLEVKDDPAVRGEYFDRWLHDELGYSRDD